MPPVQRLRTIVARHFGCANDEADRIIGEGRVLVDGISRYPAYKAEYWEEISIDGTIIRPGHRFTYIKCNKPRGVECTMNPDIDANLLTIFPFAKQLHPVGRLDKESEGLLLLTDDGRVFPKLAASEKEKEKEYFVTVDKPVDPEFAERMSTGVSIMGKLTKPARLIPDETDKLAFRIVLTQGLNRQIRRMCYKLGYRVTRLVRLRIHGIMLGDLAPGEWRGLDPAEEEIIRQVLR